MSEFKFKQFTINQEGAPFKVGTDSMILGSWVKLDGDETVLDIGTGTGVLALMLAQRLTTGKVLAVEIERKAFEIAQANVQNSPFNDKVILVNEPLQKIEPNGKFDLIVSNPPYFQDSTKKADREATTARHTDMLSFEDIVKFSDSFLKEGGRCVVVLPAKEAQCFSKIALDSDFYLTHELNIKSFEDTSAKRICLEFSKINLKSESESLSVRNRSDGLYTSEYRGLTKDYHTHF